MKRCEQFKDLILTDYMDGQLDALRVKQMEEHLLDCADCRIVFKAVKSTKVYLKQVPQEPAPAQLWSAIKNNIEQQQQRTNSLGELVEKIKELVSFPRLVPIVASVVVMFVVGSLTFNQMQIQQLKAKEQGEYLASVVSTIGSLAKAEGNDLGTPIERYFL